MVEVLRGAEFEALSEWLSAEAAGRGRWRRAAEICRAAWRGASGRRQASRARLERLEGEDYRRELESLQAHEKVARTFLGSLEAVDQALGEAPSQRGRALRRGDPGRACEGEVAIPAPPG